MTTDERGYIPGRLMKDSALLAFAKCGLAPSTEDGGMDRAAFNKFWEIFLPDLRSIINHHFAAVEAVEHFEGKTIELRRWLRRCIAMLVFATVLLFLEPLLCALFPEGLLARFLPPALVLCLTIVSAVIYRTRLRYW